MKRCPECNRTYSNESFSFCLADGALLSAPYDSDATLALPGGINSFDSPIPHTDEQLKTPPIPRKSKNEFGEAARQFVGEHTEFAHLKSTSYQLWFIPKEWANIMPKEIEGWPSPYPVAFWFNLIESKGRLGIVLEIGPLASAERRRRLVEAFRRSGFSLRAGADREEAKYSRVYTEYRPVNDFGNPEELKRIMNELWEQSSGELIRATNVIKGFPWGN
jgi:hypothetical protein